MKFTIGKYTIKKHDNINWQCTEKVKKGEIPNFGVKIPKKTVKNKQKHVLVGYYGTLTDLVMELGEILARDSNNFEELQKWIKELNKLK